MDTYDFILVLAIICFTLTGGIFGYVFGQAQLRRAHSKNWVRKALQRPNQADSNDPYYITKIEEYGNDLAK